MTLRGTLSATIDRLEAYEGPESRSAEAAITANEELMMRFATGDMSAFEQLYQRHKDALFRYLVRALSDRGLAEEFAQDVWMRLIDARARYSVTAKFRTYLFKIAHNRVIDHYRRQQPVSLTDTGLEPQVRDRLGQARDNEVRDQALHQALDKLPFEQRSAVALRIHGEFSLQQIADMTGVGRETVKSRLRYAMDKLREVLKDVPGVNHESK